MGFYLAHLTRSVREWRSHGGPWERVFLPFAIFFLAGILLPGALQAASPGLSKGMIELAIQGRKVEGTPLEWNENALHLLGRDGRLWNVNPADASKFKKTANQFRPFSPSDLRAALLSELGENYEVSGTGHYLVAHPKNQGDKWAEHFEDLYRSFTSYMTVRGVKITAPPYLLVGIVCRNQREFQQIAAENGVAPPASVVGLYALESNRITLYDMGGGGNSANWRRNASVILHEATHQMAFNTGVHNRFAPTPAWLAEGLATLFEAPGVYDAHQHPQLRDRVNRERLRDFRAAVEKQHRPELLAATIASDRLFSINPPAAYAEAWALTFFMVENEPQKYARYLEVTAARPPFEEYTAAQRTADFTALCGNDWRMLESRFLNYMKSIE
jgi:hypothetical protein